MTSPPETQHLDMRGFKLPYRRAGSGPTVLFLHGAGGSSGWTPWHAKLAESVDLIAPEHPGWDSAETPDWLDHTTDLAFFYLDVMDKLDLHNVHLVGHSLGGWTAAEVAIRNTSRLASLTLLCAVGLNVEGMQAADGFMLPPEERAKSLVYAPQHVEMMLQRAMDPDLLDLNLKNSMIAAKLLWQPRNYNPQLRKWLRVSAVTDSRWHGGRGSLLRQRCAKWGIACSIILRRRRHVPKAGARSTRWRLQAAFRPTELPMWH